MGRPTVHLLEVGDLVEIADVDDSEVLDFVCDTYGRVSREAEGKKGNIR